MPLSLGFLFRAAITLVLALHVFYMYCTARGMQETFGFRLGTTVIASLFALAMLLPLVWAVALPELPEAFAHNIMPRRRWKRGRCAACGYDLRTQIADDRSLAQCPECGRPAVEPHPPDFLQISPRTVRRFIALNLLAWLIGCAAGEAIMLNDERLFRAEVSQVRAFAPNNFSVLHSRPRCWPNHMCALGYRSHSGFFATE